MRRTITVIAALAAIVLLTGVVTAEAQWVHYTRLSAGPSPFTPGVDGITLFVEARWDKSSDCEFFSGKPCSISDATMEVFGSNGFYAWRWVPFPDWGSEFWDTFDWNPGPNPVTYEARTTVWYNTGGFLRMERASGFATVFPVDSGGPAPPDGPDILVPDEKLFGGDEAVSSDGRFRLVYQNDGNLVLYRWDWAPLWASNTGGTSVGRAHMQSDGNLVIYDAGGSRVWDSRTAGNSGAYLVVQNDGNVVIYRAGGSPIWSTGTCCH